MTLGMQEIIILIIWYIFSFLFFFCILKIMNHYCQWNLKLNFKKMFLYGFLIIFTILAIYVIISSSGSKQNVGFMPNKP
ncbi:MAG: hypothetical protein EB092_02210 [Chitinophagia bacterium]|jgi:hypothetical protein|nr:hypothetical protein [Chitinophagia bacterium]